VKLGEVVDSQYQYSVITTPSELALWVLTRDIDVFEQKYDAEVRQYLDAHNFTYIPIQQTRCLEDLTTNVQSQCQVASYLRKSGFPESAIGTMVCISKYESSYNCDATNKNTDGSTDYGLFQINSYYWCSGDTKSKYNECSATCTSLFNCQSNTNCAYTVWRQQGYNAWYGYKNHKTECDSYKVSC
jgi:lysozyme C